MPPVATRERVNNREPLGVSLTIERAYLSNAKRPIFVHLDDLPINFLFQLIVVPLYKNPSIKMTRQPCPDND